MEILGIVGFILGLLVVVEFFHVGYLVNAIHKDTAASLAELGAIKKSLADQPLREGSKLP